MLTFIRISLKITLPLLVLGGFIYWGQHLLATAPEQSRRVKTATPTHVNVIALRPQTYQIRLQTSGRIQAAVRSTLAAEVKGQVTQVSPHFHVGGRISSGEMLIEIDDTDYQQSLIIVQAELAQAQLAVEQGDAERDQALRDRALLGLSDKPSQLALREPQRKSNLATLAAAKARVTQARTQLARTKVTTPFDGQITAIKANVGQYVNAGSAIADLVSTEKLEVRLPLSDAQLAFISFKPLVNTTLPVTLKAGQSTWLAKLVRVEGIVDTQSLQQIAIAEISPLSDDVLQPSLGLFVAAEIEATLLQDVIVIPRSAVRNNHEIQVVTVDNKLINQKLVPIWADEENFIIADNIINGNSEGLNIIKHPIALAADGIEVIVTNEATDQP